MGEDLNIIKVTFLTKSGLVECYIERPTHLEAEEIATEFANELSTRPQWMSVGNVCFFSGAVSAITVDIHDREAA